MEDLQRGKLALQAILASFTLRLTQLEHDYDLLEHCLENEFAVKGLGVKRDDLKKEPLTNGEELDSFGKRLSFLESGGKYLETIISRLRKSPYELEMDSVSETDEFQYLRDQLERTKIIQSQEIIKDQRREIQENREMLGRLKNSIQDNEEVLSRFEDLILKYTEDVELRQEQLEDQREFKKELDLREELRADIEQSVGLELRKANERARALLRDERLLEKSFDNLVTAQMQFEARVEEFERREKQFRAVQQRESLERPCNLASFVLDAMIRIYSQNKEGGTGFERSFLEISLILEQLLQVAPSVEPKHKTEALKLANNWKANLKVTAATSIEILCFLQFIAAFQLENSFNGKEIFELFETAAQHQQARNVSRVLGFTDKIPVIVDRLMARGQYIEAVRVFYIFNCKYLLSPVKLRLDFKELRSPVQLLVKVYQDACTRFKMGNAKVREDEYVAVLKSILDCIEDCKLSDSFELLKQIEKDLAEQLEQRM